ncbi:hypothetical protein [Ilumatobacter nonamiensis]|uniref:hypothetical protein n=1 Tax=Ilumatobacter nonamiensis TaxID=467093 RepID=UPI00034CDBE1|nr:hypothetical protein [Ilumatobacter nonamiensis]
MHRANTRILSIAAVTALTLAAAACGGDDDGGSSDGADSPVGEALAAEILDDSEGESVAQTEEEARCWAGSIVDDIGEERLEELGVTADNVSDIDDIGFSDDEVDGLVDGMFDCIDVTATFAEQFTEDFGEEGAQCVAESLDEDFVKDLMRSVVSGEEAEPSEEFFQDFLDIAAECDLPLG